MSVFARPKANLNSYLCNLYNPCIIANFNFSEAEGRENFALVGGKETDGAKGRGDLLY